MRAKFINVIARNLRRKSTHAEILLWRHLRAKQVEGLKFKRQEPIGNYIVDFVCFKKRVVIEVDGGQHAVEKDKDKERDKWLEGQGFKVLRFWNNEVSGNMEGVLEVIRENCLDHPPLTPPIKGGGKGEMNSMEGERGKESNGGGKRNAQCP